MDALDVTQLLTLREAAEYLRRSEGTLRYWRYRNEGPASFSQGRRVFYEKADLDAWLAAEKARTGRGGVRAS